MKTKMSAKEKKEYIEYLRANPPKPRRSLFGHAFYTQETKAWLRKAGLKIERVEIEKDGRKVIYEQAVR